MLLDGTRKNLLIELINKGLSINVINKETGMAKSTIYYHYKKIRGRKYVVPKFEVKGSENEGEIAGLFAADGGCCIKDDYRTTFFLGSDEEEYAHAFADLLEEYFHKKPYWYNRKKSNVIYLTYHSKSICSFFRQYLDWKCPKTHSITLKTQNRSADFIKGFLRGYLDGDGYTSASGVIYVSVSQQMMSQIFELLEKLGFSPKMTVYHGKYKPCYYVKISKDKAAGFLELIRPRNKKRSGAARI